MGEQECGFVHHLNRSEQCDFVRNNTDCQDSGGLINYLEVRLGPPDFVKLSNILCLFLQIYYCLDNFKYRPGVAGGLTLWLTILFVSLGLSADHFFCPNLARISKSLRYAKK